MPTQIEMRLKATWTVRPDTRSLHGLACALFEGQAEPGGPAHIAPDKPWTVSPLSPGGTDAQWLWRVTWLPDAAAPASALTADVIRVGHASCVVLESTHRRVSHATLAAGPPKTEVTVELGSPTFFSRGGADLLLPDPRLMADSWQRKWNASLPASDGLLIDDETWRETRRLVSLASFDLQTTERDAGHGRPRASGFTGTATLRLDRGAPPAVRRMLGTLSRFAEYCGTGAQTTHGFGVTRLVASR
jgi:CRISPR-associated endoribonuclease Cas6